jgi:hypothetical protein
VGNFLLSIAGGDNAPSQRRPPNLPPSFDQVKTPVDKDTINAWTAAQGVTLSPLLLDPAADGNSGDFFFRPRWEKIGIPADAAALQAYGSYVAAVDPLTLTPQLIPVDPNVSCKSLLF